MKHLSYLIAIFAVLSVASCCRKNATSPENDCSQFVLITDVIPEAILEIRYYSTYNFIGDRIHGYDMPVALMTRQACDSLKAVSLDLMEQGYRIKIYDAYRPQCAVDHFMAWAADTTDARMKQYFYPELEKSVLIPQGFIAEKSGHTRGSTVDLTLFDMETEKEVDMGCTFDYFGKASFPTLQAGEDAGSYQPINEEQYRNRMILRQAMVKHGFDPYDCEWWHFRLKDEPFPDTYFTFPINIETISKVSQR